MASNVSLRRLAYLGLAYGCVGLGAAGIVLPLLPTTPFLLVAAWAASKGSPRVEAWLYDHLHFGPPLRAWHEQRAVPRRAKWIACLLLLSSWLVLWLSTDSPIVPVITGLLFMGVATFLVTRPDVDPETIRVSDDPG